MSSMLGLGPESSVEVKKKGRVIAAVGVVAVLILGVVGVRVFHFTQHETAAQTPQAEPAPQNAWASSVVIKTPYDPTAVAVDGHGNVWIADFSEMRMQKFAPPGKTGYGPPSLQFDLRPSSPSSLAVDGKGNVYIAVSAGPKRGHIVKIAPDGKGGYGRPVNFGNTDNYAGVAADESGNVYVADTFNHRVVKYVPNGSGGYTQSVISSEVKGPWAIAVDGSGNLYVACRAGHLVLKFAPDGSGGYVSPVTVGLAGTGEKDPAGIAVDRGGNIYVTVSDLDVEDGSLLEYSPNGTGGYIQSIISGGLQRPDGIAVDGSSNIYVVEAKRQHVLKLTAAGS